jgi:hypothetical protein
MVLMKQVLQVMTVLEWQAVKAYAVQATPVQVGSPAVQPAGFKAWLEVELKARGSCQAEE